MKRNKITSSPQFESIKPSNTCLTAHSNLLKINSFKSIFITKIHAHPSKITHLYQNHFTPMPKHPYFSHTLSTLVHTKNQAQPCHKSPIISSHHFMQSQYQTITPRPNHMSSLSKYAPIKTHIKLHSNTHSFMTNQPKSTQSTQNFSHYQSRLINSKNHHMHLPY